MKWICTENRYEMMLGKLDGGSSHFKREFSSIVCSRRKYVQSYILTRKNECLKQFVSITFTPVFGVDFGSWQAENGCNLKWDLEDVVCSAVCC